MPIGITAVLMAFYRYPISTHITCLNTSDENGNKNNSFYFVVR